MVQQPSDVHFATVSLSTDVTLHYAERGDQKGEAIVFLHAYTDSWFAFSRVLHLLSASYHAFAPDERGHGDSDKPECCYTVDERLHRRCGCVHGRSGDRGGDARR